MTIRKFNQYQPQLGNKVYVDETALVVGNVQIGEDSSIWPMAVLRGDVHSIHIGARTSIQDGTVCHVTHAGPYDPEGHDLYVGDNVTIGHKAILHGCRIESNCLIGMGTVVMDGALIKENVIVGANSLVPPGRVLESGYLWVGSPARKIRKLTEEETEFFKYSADNYVKLKNQYLNQED
ncbi:gamma carbonic anhydrase family protein [Kangiella profundi]|uniref:Gamma carbonic anhydrase family protein n=1 Tax=Kangiella profundi TaxID=1561924 RepID=A0A2K9AXQ4_9GAMM|nr:gamma carbonic anhydrase family protein [Kangiella profundi]AUD79921.1 gamma carbonic anhydrase family protein [Kangiella profundi]GGE94196.1 gamma carbonic anhydrase family protein [Kangiella profundi]